MLNPLITIFTFGKLEVGCFVKEKLEVEGIEISQSHIPQGVRLKVRANDSEKAIRTLLQIHKEYNLEQIMQDSSIEEKK